MRESEIYRNRVLKRCDENLVKSLIIANSTYCIASVFSRFDVNLTRDK
ncbi:MAG: hypothetical protein QXJ68_06290 [Methanocellales archaeon]